MYRFVVGIMIAVAAIIVLGGLMRLTSPGVLALANREKDKSGGGGGKAMPPAGWMGRDRVASWFMAPAGEAPSSPEYRAPEQRQTQTSAIRWWLIGGALLIGLAVPAWLLDYPVLGLALAALALVVIAVAVRWWRNNRWLDQARNWNTGHPHEFPRSGDG